MLIFSPKAEPRIGIMYDQQTLVGLLVYGKTEALLRAWFPDAEIVPDPAFPEFPFFVIVSDAEFRRAVIAQVDPPDPSACDFIAREVQVDTGSDDDLRLRVAVDPNIAGAS